jgi:hypothetical protein
MSKLKQYLHHYIGCKCMSDERIIVELTPRLLNIALEYNWKPILKPLSSMSIDDVESMFPNLAESPTVSTQSYTGGYCVALQTSSPDELEIEIHNDGSILCKSKDNNEFYCYNGGELFSTLCEHGFDLFRLLDERLAIELKAK